MTPHRLDRRSFLWQSGGGLGGIALAHLLGVDGLLAAGPSGGVRERPRPAACTTRRGRSGSCSSSCRGRPASATRSTTSPSLIKRHGQKFDPGGKVELFQSSPGAVMASPWAWQQYGECGKWVSDLVPHLAGCVDDIAFVHSMVAKSNVHGPATFMQTTGFVLPGLPEHGGVGPLRPGQPEREPADVRRPARPRGFAPNGPANWSAGFLPASTRGR